MSELIKSLEKSVHFLQQRYPADLPLLLSLQAQLCHLSAKQRTLEKNPPATATATGSGPAD